MFALLHGVAESKISVQGAKVVLSNVFGSKSVTIIAQYLFF